MKIKSTSQAPKVQALFSLSNGKGVYGAFDGGKLSVVGGAPLLYLVEQTSNYIARVAECIRDWRAPHLIKFSMWSLIWQRVVLICSGYADGLDSDRMRHDGALKLALGLDPYDSERCLASQPSMSRLENGLSSKDCYRIAAFMLFFYIQRKGSCPREIILDFDGSCVPAYGDQQGTSYKKYYDTNMYFPLFVYDQEGWLICAILRPGKDGESRLTVPVLKRIVKALRQSWPNVKIIIRVDAAFGSQRLYDWCEDQGKANEALTVYYIVCFRTPKDGTGVAGSFRHLRDKTRRLFGRKFGPQQYKYKDAPSKGEVEKQYKELEKKQRKAMLKELRGRVVKTFGDERYQAGKGGKDPKGWRCERRVVAACIQDDWGIKTRYWVTNLPYTAQYQAQYLIEDLYSARGGMELRIKEYKALEGDRLSCREFTANQARLTFHALAYNMMYQLRENLPAARRSWSFKTLQAYLIKIAVRITQAEKAIVLHWASHFEWKREFWSCTARLRAKFG